MNRLLTRDEEYFNAKFSNASQFLVAAHNRYEAYVLTSRYAIGQANAWDRERLRLLLLEAPSCREEWFIQQLRNDFKGIEVLLGECNL